jgi:polypeptide N-acetylgalactosaminyltransferase
MKTLPSTSVIIIFYNEHLSILLRTLHSVYNRTPKELLHEIILVNDASTKQELYEKLQIYVNENFDERVKILNNKERKGLIVTRMVGARVATGEVLMFLDSHMEVNVNWLPPLLGLKVFSNSLNFIVCFYFFFVEPIAIDPKTSTIPTIDNFFHDTFAYQGAHPARGVFDWNFIFQWLPRRDEDENHPEKPFESPIMLGGAFAIRRDYFFDLGGYDEKLLIWNGENYEISFKLWLCSDNGKNGFFV